MNTPSDPIFPAGLSHLRSPIQVTVSARTVARMQAVAAATEQVAALAPYQAHVLSNAPAAAQQVSTLRGVFCAFDFHPGTPETQDWPQLIEINTNAGGAAVLGQNAYRNPFDWARMFRDEWALFCEERRTSHLPLRQIAIVDDAPEQQFLYAEFVALRDTLSAAGLPTLIADASALEFDGTHLRHAGVVIDLVYNRLTDFDLSASHHAVLAAAWATQAVAITPNPRVHALFANKRNLTVLQDARQLAVWGAVESDCATLAAAIPPTELVSPLAAADFWARRKSLFFKPVAGYGAKAVYRGDRMTRRVFDMICRSEYVAQRVAEPGVCTLDSAGETQAMHYDLRLYTYAGQPLSLVARVWRGQTVNFRLPGSGFAAVHIA